MMNNPSWFSRCSILCL